MILCAHLRVIARHDDTVWIKRLSEGVSSERERMRGFSEADVVQVKANDGGQNRGIDCGVDVVGLVDLLNELLRTDMKMEALLAGFRLQIDGRGELKARARRALQSILGDLIIPHLAQTLRDGSIPWIELKRVSERDMRCRWIALCARLCSGLDQRSHGVAASKFH